MTPLAGCGVLITRPAGQGGELAEGLVRLGATVHTVPAIAVSPREADVIEAVRAAASADWIVFTSGNAARLFLGAVAPATPLPRIACIGPATAETVRAAGYEVAVLPAAGAYRAEGLLEALLAHPMSGRSVLIPAALVTRDVLAAGLAAAGAIVRKIPIYETKVAPEAAAEMVALLAARAVDVVTFTSSSTVDAFHELVPEAPPGVLFAAIGPVTAETARARGYEPLLTASIATVAGLLDTLAAHYQRGSQ